MAGLSLKVVLESHLQIVSIVPRQGSNGHTALWLLCHNVSDTVLRASTKDISQALSSLLTLCAQTVSTGWLLAVSNEIDGGLGGDRSSSTQRSEGLAEEHDGDIG